jgi:hypothetical protein
MKVSMADSVDDPPPPGSDTAGASTDGQTPAPAPVEGTPADGAAAAVEDTPIPEPKKASQPTHFNFEHAVFKVKEAVFTLSPNSEEATYNVPLGEVRAALPIDLVAGSFGVAKESPDAELLKIVKRGLKYVKEIRPGDSIPSELLDGSASWSVEPRHRELARARVTLQFAWSTEGKALDSIDRAEFEHHASLPDTQKKLQQAYVAIAEKLGFGKDNVQDLVGRGDELAREWTYIEALRERFGKIQKLYAGFATLRPIYKRERAIQEDIIRIRALMKKPVEEIQTLFDQLDANTGEIVNTMKKFPSQIRYIRDTRDGFHQRFMTWDGLIAEWEDVPLERSLKIDRLVRVSYRFLAHHFPLDSEWALQNY